MSTMADLKFFMTQDIIRGSSQAVTGCIPSEWAEVGYDSLQEVINMILSAAEKTKNIE